MSDLAATSPSLLTRPKRKDARANYDKLLAAAAAAFAEHGSSASLEDVARRAGVGIGTLYRHFPTREELLAAVYVGELEAVCRSAADFDELPPWDALSGWLRRYVGYAATKRILADELIAYIGADDPVFAACRTALVAAGEPLVARAQEAGVVRPDTSFMEIARMVGGIAGIKGVGPEELDHILELALDGLRYTA